MRTILLATLLACTALTACVETRFESPLGDNIETCDTAWKGLWLEPGDDGRRVDGEHHLSGFAVDDACAFTVVEQLEGGGPLKRTRVPINFVHAHGDDYVVVSDAALHGLVDASCSHQGGGQPRHRPGAGLAVPQVLPQMCQQILKVGHGGVGMAHLQVGPGHVGQQQHAVAVDAMSFGQCQRRLRMAQRAGVVVLGVGQQHLHA